MTQQSAGSQMLEALKPGIEAGAQGEVQPSIIPPFLASRAVPETTEQTRASETERLVREVLARARPTVTEDSQTPAQLAVAEYHQLRLDNMVLADELRAALIERDVEREQAQRLRVDLVAVSAKADAHVKALATLRAEMLVAGRLIVELIGKVDKELDPQPEAVQAYRPKPAVSL